MKKFYSLMLTALIVFFVASKANAMSTNSSADQEDKATVTLKYTNESARKAVEMIFNITKLKSIAYEGIESFEVDKGDKVRLLINTKDYDITVNNEKIEPADGATTPYVITVTEDITYTITATEREYGTTLITLCANGLEGLVLREGTIDGPVIDESNIERTGTVEYTFGSIVSKKTAILDVYSITVSSKTPKVYVSEAKDYWIEASEYPDGKDYMPTYVSTFEHPINVLSHKIERDKKMVVYLSVGGNVKADNVVLRDNNHEVYPLQQGYNEFMIDVKYSNEFTALVYSETSVAPTLSFYCNKTSVGLNANTQQYTANVFDNALMHIFAGRTAPAKYTVTADIDDAATSAKIVVDRFDTITKDNPSVSTFAGCEVAVTPGENGYTLDDVAPVYDGDTHVFKITGNHKIVLGGDVPVVPETPVTIIVSPSASDEPVDVADFKSFKIEFQGAKEVAIKEGVGSDEIIFRKSDFTWAAYSCTVTAVADAECPIFTITPNPLPTVGASYTYMIPAGYFVINGSLENDDLIGEFTLKQDINMDEVLVVSYPETDEVDIKDFYGVTIIYGTEQGEYQLEANDEKLSEMVVKLNGKELVLSEDYELKVSENIVMFSFNKVEDGTLSISIPAGAFTISGFETYAFEREWEIVDPVKIVQMVVSPTADDEPVDVADFKSFKVEFPNAKEVAIKDGIGNDEIIFRKSDFTWAAYSCTVTAVADAECPTFTITPNPLPTVGASYKYMIPAGYFIINGSLENEDVIGEFTLKQDINMDDVPVISYPETDEVDIKDFYGVTIIYGTEQGEYQLEANDEKLSEMVVKLNGKELVLSEDYELEVSENIVMFSFNKVEDGTLSISIPAGAFTISGFETYAFEREWEIVDPVKIVQMAVSPTADDEPVDVADFKSFKVEFPNAKEVAIKDGIGNDEIIFRKSDFTWAAYSCTVTAVADAECPTFTITPNPLPTVGASYTYMIPAGYFVINGSLENEDVIGEFTLKQDINMDDVPVISYPETDEVDIKDFYGVTIIYGTEQGEYQLEVNDEKLSEMVVKLNGKELVLYEDYELEVSENIVMFSFNKVEDGTLSISIPAGAFTISGFDTYEFEREWEIVDPVKIVQMVVSPTADDEPVDVADFKSFKVEFPNAKEVAIKDGIGNDEIIFRKSDFTWAAYSCTVTAVADAECPTFTITPNPLPTVGASYTYMIPAGYFIINGSLENEDVIGEFTLKQDINMDDVPVVSYPETDEVDIKDFYGVTIIYGTEQGEYQLEANEEKLSEMVVKLNGKELVLFEDYELEVSENIVMFSFNKVEDGTLSISIPAGAFTISGFETYAFEREWEIVDPITTGISSVNVNASKKATVVAVDGRIVLRDANVNDIKTLPNGIYVVNGKKVIK